MKSVLILTFMFIANVQFANAQLLGGFDKFKRHTKKTKKTKTSTHNKKIVASYFSGTGGILGMGFGSPRQIDVKYTYGEKAAMEHGKLDAASEILNEVGKKGNKNLVAKYYVREGRVDKADRETWSNDAKDEYLVNYKGYPASKRPETQIQTRNERIMAEKSRRETLIAFHSFAQSDEERKIIESLLTKSYYLTDDDKASMANIQEKVHVNQDGRFPTIKQPNIKQKTEMLNGTIDQLGSAK